MKLNDYTYDFYNVSALKEIQKKLYEAGLVSRVVEVGKSFQPSDTPNCTIVLSSYILVKGDNETYQLKLGVDSSCPNYWLLPESTIIHPEQIEDFGDNLTYDLYDDCCNHRQSAVNFVTFEGLVEFLSTGMSFEMGSKSLFLIERYGVGYSSPYSLNGMGIELSNNTWACSFYDAQLEQLREKAMIPEYEDESHRDVPPLVKIDLEYIADHVLKRNAEAS